jgi:hypothetical protein
MTLCKRRPKIQNYINGNAGKAAIFDYPCNGDLHPNDVAAPDSLKVALMASPAPHIPRHAMAIPPRKMVKLNNLKKTRPPKRP